MILSVSVVCRAGLLAFLLAVAAAGPAVSGCHLQFKRMVIQIGTNIGPHVRQRILSYVNSIPDISVEQSKSVGWNAKEIDELSKFPGNQLLLAVGNASWSNEYIPSGVMSSLHPESFHILFKPVTPNSRTYILASNGSPLDFETHRNVSFDKARVHYGAVVGAYAALEELGFAFLHPLEPYIPSQLAVRNRQCYGTNGLSNATKKTPTVADFTFNRTETPYWPERGFHLHTQHPLELTEVLQGHDIPQFGPHGPSCKQFSKTKPLRANGVDSTAAYIEESTIPTKLPSGGAVSVQGTGTGGAASSVGKTTKGGKGATGAPIYCERWEDMVTDVDYFFEWAVANRLNKVEWLLLGSYKWGDEWETRRNRLRTLTTLGHQYSLLVGADVPLGNVQQHGWHIVNLRLPFPQQARQIRERVDWVLNAGFDFLTTESGLSEFTHPECDHMLELMNIFAEHVNVTWGREAAIKVHCSTGQTCDNFLDPRTGEPINFNFLPTYAHPGMGVFPHTVQVYALDDPTAYAYGNANFSYVEDYLVYEAKQHKRSVSFYGETAYWVNVDIDVPLFLPLYGQRRQHDLRRLALREAREGFRMDGQMNFDSGWEWGYWLSDVVTARASWQPHLHVAGQEGAGPGGGTGVSGAGIKGAEQCSSASWEKPSGADAGDRNCAADSKYPPEYEASQDQWAAYALSIQPYTHLYGPEFGPRLNDFIVELAQAQAEVLVRGKVNGTDSPDLKKLTGIAYLSGGDTWVDVPRLFGMAFTQPDKVHIREAHDPQWPHALMLLQEMTHLFAGLARKMDAIYADVSAHAQLRESLPVGKRGDAFHINNQAIQLLSEVRDSTSMLALRAQQVWLLYQSRDTELGAEEAQRKELQRQARAIVHRAEEVVARREAHYRVPWQRIAEWRENPTVYRFGYLWAVHSLYYWWRDQGLAEHGSLQSEHNPCYLNRMDPTEVAVGWGKHTLEVLRAFINRYTPFSAGSPLEVVNCLSPPAKGYEFPMDLYHF